MSRETIALALSKVKETKVQFAISDDLKKAVDSLNSATAGINKSIANYEASYKSMQGEANGAKSVIASQTKLISMADTKAKELGVPASSIPGYSEANKAWMVANDAIDKVNEFQ